MENENNSKNAIENIYYNKFKEIYVESLLDDNLLKIVSENINKNEHFYQSVLSGAKKAHKEMEKIFSNIYKRR